jgi:hypothetical protein
MYDDNGVADEEFLNEARRRKDANGWTVTGVEARVPYAYTVGLHERGLPELLVVGMAREPMVRLLSLLADRTFHGERLDPGQRIRAGGMHIEVVEVENPDAHLDVVVALYGRDFRALQLVWSDERGRWPWVAAFDAGRGSQPVFGVRAFRAERRVALSAA